VDQSVAVLGDRVVWFAKPVTHQKQDAGIGWWEISRLIEVSRVMAPSKASCELVEVIVLPESIVMRVVIPWEVLALSKK
jgi:hypothetical protein